MRAFRLAALAALLVCLVGAQSASAARLAGLSVGDQLGKFTVQGGELIDTVSYRASWRTVGSCWTTEFRDAGDPNMGWIIKIHGNKKARVAKLKLQRFGALAAVQLPSNWLLASGTAERDWSGFADVRWAPQPGYEDECNSPDPPAKPEPRPPDDAVACGTDAVHLEKTGLALLAPPAGHDALYGPRAELSGTPVPSEGLSLGLCPSEATLTGNVTALPVLDGAVDSGALSRLALARTGEEIKLSGHVNLAAPGHRRISFDEAGWTNIDSTGQQEPWGLAEWVSGGYTTAEFHWTLTLKKVK